MEPIAMKGAVLLIAAVIGGLSIYLGYRLFKTGIEQHDGRIERHDGTVEGEGAGFKLKLTNYGPGVVFVLFGASLVIFAITRDLSTTSTVATQTGQSPDGTECVGVETFTSVSAAAADAAAAPGGE